MVETLGTVRVSPSEEAARLWEGATAMFGRARGDFGALLSALNLGVRAVEIAAIPKLQRVSGSFPATIQAELEAPPEEVDVARDALAAPKSIHFVEVLDLLSDDALDCVGPNLHRGWEDKRPACLRSRKLAREATGARVDASSRKQLLLLAAYRNRLFWLPPPVRVVVPDVISAFPALARLYEGIRSRA
jgi:hypothetical protein